MVKAYAPANIAWIKYMGKDQGRPLNASFSMTLDQLGSSTRMTRISDSKPLRFTFSGESYNPPPSGQAKISAFLSDLNPFFKVLQLAGFDAEFESGHYEIETFNTIPAGTGIASSASGFAALTLAWFGVLSGSRFKDWTQAFQEPRVLEEVARVAGLGSGSACRSFHGPFVEWSEDGRVIPFDSKMEFVDFILLYETEPKKVSSSEAHVRVLSSPLFEGRRTRTRERLGSVKQSLNQFDPSTLAKVVREEALDMHELFHTSRPPFTYLNERSLEWLQNSSSGIVTADAGANIHVFVPAEQEEMFKARLTREYPGLSYLCSRAGRGARYVQN